MDLLHHYWHDGQLFGRDINVWTIVGWCGMAIFGTRFFVQWYATERRRQVTVPAAFWWLSLTGSLMMLTYAVFYDKHAVIILSYALTWIPYCRNLILHYRHERARKSCPECGVVSPPTAIFCSQCGARIGPEEPAGVKN